MYRTTVFVAAAWTVTFLAGAYLGVRPYLTDSQALTLTAGLVVALGLPTVAMFVYWWVNASVFGADGRRPREA